MLYETNCNAEWFMGCIWALAFVIAVNTVFPFFHILTQCRPIMCATALQLMLFTHTDYFSDLFRAGHITRRCRSAKAEQPVMYAQSAIGVVIDICLFGLPIWIIRKTMIYSGKMVQVIVVFGVGLLVNITGVIRLVVFVTTDFSVNPYVSP